MRRHCLPILLAFSGMAITPTAYADGNTHGSTTVTFQVLPPVTATGGSEAVADSDNGTSVAIDTDDDHGTSSVSGNHGHSHGGSHGRGHGHGNEHGHKTAHPHPPYARPTIHRGGRLPLTGADLALLTLTGIAAILAGLLTRVRRRALRSP
jgi:hypothetical protein